MAGLSSTSGQTPILLATGNPAKQQMLRWLVEGLALTPTTPEELGLDASPGEEGDTHQAIARHKAQQYSLAGSTLAIASDGGLVLPALGDRWQSRYTHRFAGPAADDAERVRRLLQLMEPYKGTDREASWLEGLAIARRGKVLASWELQGGTGVIAEAPSDTTGAPGDTPGFWAFSIWYFPQFGKTYSQLSTSQRESMDDHWGRLRQLVHRYFNSYFVTAGN